MINVTRILTKKQSYKTSSLKMLILLPQIHASFASCQNFMHTHKKQKRRLLYTLMVHIAGKDVVS